MNETQQKAWHKFQNSVMTFAQFRTFEAEQRRSQVIKLRESGKTFGEIAFMLGLTRQRIYQMYRKAIPKTSPKRDMLKQNTRNVEKQFHL